MGRHTDARTRRPRRRPRQPALLGWGAFAAVLVGAAAPAAGMAPPDAAVLAAASAAAFGLLWALGPSRGAGR